MKPINDQTIRLPIKDFAKKIICDGHLYLQANEGRRFYLMKPGIFVDESFIKKHATNQTVFDYVSVVDSDVTAKFVTLFRELKYLQFEKDLRVKTMEIVAYFKSTFESKHHFLSFALACYQEFCAIPETDMKRLHDTDLYLFRKSLYSAAFAVITGFANDFYHYPMVKDFFNLTLGLDIGLCETNYSYFVAQACNQENISPGTGRKWMKDEGASELEIDVFFHHPQKSYKFFESNVEILAYPELKEVLLYQHELSNGKGFPRGIPKGQVSSWESIIVFASSLVDIRDEYEFEVDVLNYIFNFQNQKLNDLPIHRVYQKLCAGVADVYKTKENAG